MIERADLDRSLRSSPRAFRQVEPDVLRRAWSQADEFVTSLPRLRVADTELVAQKRLTRIARALRSWVAPFPSLSCRFGFGRIGTLGTHHACVLLRARTNDVFLTNALKQRESLIWAPPGGWEDLVLLKRGKIVAWSSTHNSISVFRSMDASGGEEVTPNFAVELELSFSAFAPEVRERIIALFEAE